ncbi:NHLP family bacteriocin export ABC transporter peptidase/permease/ATPase subunit [Bradyrhizobium sp. 61]|uniref:NHLP family bacteriocin export ABC transporter peptidase/permease/ATPase subunit n=1 Tax=unclassified Bradyrhizobium TaxID=2631580 RepID=UPI001FFBE21F|nr:MULTISPECIES: NHLP family bacteriocin export ABC transporter peptidase/permease/ATPase subunit [unclassified Bradyrhizobium]MCK1275958.1 NHLP family bacteriocin export ABC transporter peptidase/permease/ATPase subunit [Bradyrhizobium sp. 61]MCK1448051.1 NHLP family bacteriocin export ABC transporter peptidase/permease/ATPase subunit [Bradyrhizobium sp. 48]MCK1465449.1 NHLP family bacteriocin export ABC transporter peptidase/permease/ATPase subunit [Bradyrhizobium sp. 2]
MTGLSHQADNRPGLLDRLGNKIGRMRRRWVTPTVFQMEALECGAASLAMILAYHGLWVPLEKLREACGVSRDGSKASNVLKAARQFGLTAKGFRKEPATLHELPMPSIIHWNFNHFVVLEKLDSDCAYVNDPSVGRRKVGHEEFDAAFTGVVLAMEPGPGFKAGGREPDFFPLLLRQLSNSFGAVVLLVALSMALVVPAILVPAFAKIFVDDVLIKRAEGWFTPLLIGMGITALARALMTAFQQSLLLRIQTKLTVTMVSRLIWHVLTLPMEFFTQRHSGDLANRVAASEQIAQLLSNGVAANALNLVSVIFIAITMAFYDGLLAAISVAMALLNVVVLRLVARQREDFNRKLVIERAKLNGSTIEIIRTIETIKAGGLEDDAFARWAGFQAKVLNAERDLGVYSTFLDACPIFLTGLTIAVVLGVGGLRIVDGALTIGGLVALQALLASLVEPVNALVQQTTAFLTIKGNLFRIEDVFNYPARPLVPIEHAPAGMPPKLSGRVELKDISFGYSALEPPLIEDFSLVVEPGRRVALIGSSGSGKSTIGRLISGLYRPWSGDICIDGWPLAEIPQEIFTNSVAYVDQEILLFEATARDNLTLWDDTVPEASVSRALKDAVIHEEVAVRAGNYDCQIAEDGRNFSGGQRQRLEIARALVGNPSVIVLDEATSALDPIVEKAIDDNLRRRGCTCIIVAHRLSTIRDCDEILVMNNGRVVQRGTHQELLAEGGEYVQLVSAE